MSWIAVLSINLHHILRKKRHYFVSEDYGSNTDHRLSAVLEPLKNQLKTALEPFKRFLTGP